MGDGFRPKTPGSVRAHRQKNQRRTHLGPGTTRGTARPAPAREPEKSGSRTRDFRCSWSPGPRQISFNYFNISNLGYICLTATSSHPPRMKWHSVRMYHVVAIPGSRAYTWNPDKNAMIGRTLLCGDFQRPGATYAQGRICRQRRRVG